MSWTATEDARELLDHAGEFLRARAASNTVLLTATEGLRERGASLYGDEPPLLGWWSSEGHVVGAFMHTPPYPLHLSRLPAEALAPLADLLARRGRQLVAVDAPGGLAAEFAALWTAAQPLRAVPALRLRLYRLSRLRAPQSPPAGSAVVAGREDRELLVAWLGLFEQDAGTWPSSDAARVVDGRLASGAYTLWRDGEGQAVSLAGVSRSVAGSQRLGPVFTPSDQRGRGYGAAVTAAACRRALDEGADELLLFADADNPVSNRLYERLGFRTLEERAALRFEQRS